MTTPPKTEIVSLELESLEGTGLKFVGHSGALTVPFDSGPDVQAINPVRMLLLSLGACTGMDVISILRKKRLVVTGYEIALRGERRAEHPRSYHTIDVVHRVRGHDLNLAAVEEAVRLSATKYCSVSAQIAPTAAITHRTEILPA